MEKSYSPRDRFQNWMPDLPLWLECHDKTVPYVILANGSDDALIQNHVYRDVHECDGHGGQIYAPLVRAEFRQVTLCQLLEPGLRCIHAMPELVRVLPKTRRAGIRIWITWSFCFSIKVSLCVFLYWSYIYMWYRCFLTVKCSLFVICNSWTAFSKRSSTVNFWASSVRRRQFVVSIRSLCLVASVFICSRSEFNC